MDYVEAIFLGIVQGLTEFLPISSSGHLMLAQSFLGMQKLDKLVLFDLVCHLGTLLTILVFFFKDIIHLFSRDRNLFLGLCIGTLPLTGVVFVLPTIEKLFHSPQLLWLPFLLTGILLFLCERTSKQEIAFPSQKPSRLQAFWIGCMQAIAVTPGISRSASTITAARLAGLSKEAAVTFSFLLAIPAILGGMTLELLKTFLSTSSDSVYSIGYPAYLAAFFSSFFTGCVALSLLMQLLQKDRLKLFAWYCIGVSFFTLVYFFVI